MSSNVIWLDANIDSQENFEYIKELRSIGSIRLRLSKSVDKSIKILKNIDFQETKIIISGRLYPEFIKSFRENILDICVAPKIIVFTRSKKKFLEYNKGYQDEDNAFYSSGGIASSFEELKKLLLNKFVLNKIDISDDAQLTFEYIDSIEKLILPLFFKALIDNTANEKTQKYTNYLYETYSKEKEQVKNLLGSILSFSKIPIEILSKYYAKLYTADSNFYKDINKDLGQNKKEKYMQYIKTLYEGVKLKSLPLSSNNMLYRGAKISKEEINIIKENFKKKKEGLPSTIVFSKSFLSFTKDKKVAEKFLKIKNDNSNLSKVIYILEKDDNIGYNLSTHSDIEKISFYPNEREVLFFPFSSFEIKDMEEIKIGDEIGYKIHLLYLGKYIKEIKKNEKITIKENKIPDCEFKNQLTEFGLIKKEVIEKSNTKNLCNEYNKYEEVINNNQNNPGINAIKGEINITREDINKDIQIINSYDNLQREGKIYSYDTNDKLENEKEIKDNVEISINGEKIEFSYMHKFEKEGTYNIEYMFKNNITKANHIFYDCSKIINLNLSYFNTQDATNMSDMFSYCESLSILNLSNFNTQNVTNMSSMFSGCKSLANLDLLKFNTKNVIDMNNMFSGCESLSNLNLSNFNTEKVNNMSNMFSGCKSLTNLNISNFNTQNVTDMNNMFSDCELLTNLNFLNFNTQNVTNMYRMFYGCESLMNLNLSNFNTQKVTYMSYMFTNCKSLTNLNLSNFNTQNVTNMSDMFSGCKSLKNLKISNFNTQNVINMSSMFSGCKSLTILNLSKFNTQKVSNMDYMFSYCESLININVSNFNTDNVKNMKYMFTCCKSLTNLNLSSFNTQNVKNMSYMFSDCEFLANLNLLNFNTENITDMSEMFSGCKSLTKDNVNTQDTKILNTFLI